MANMQRQAPMSDEERKELCEKMDKDLDAFMEEMAAKRKATDTERKPFNFDEWCKEIDEHPAFMTDLKTDGELPPHIQALQAMKYSEEDEEDRQDAAENCKKEGNKHFKFKKYRWATDCYTDGLKKMCGDRKLNAVLYANRAAAQRHIGNMRSAIRDCVFARKFDPTHLKAIVRGAECMVELGYAQRCLDWIQYAKREYENLAEKEVDEAEEKKQFELMEKVCKQADEVLLTEQRNARKQRIQEQKELAKKTKYLTAFKERNLSFYPKVDFNHPELFEWSSIEIIPSMVPASVDAKHLRVEMNEAGKLVWSMLVQYPEYGETDFLFECEEDVMVGNLMQGVLDAQPPWDKEHKYIMDNVSFFINDQYDEFVMEVYPWTEIGVMLQYPNYQIKHGLPVLMVYTKEMVERALKRCGSENKFEVL